MSAKLRLMVLRAQREKRKVPNLCLISSFAGLGA
jgi:hypothetical protein